MEHLLQKSKCSIFHNILKYIFGRLQKALLWRKGLRNKFNFGPYTSGLLQNLVLSPSGSWNHEQMNPKQMGSLAKLT